METINDELSLENENLLEQSINLLLEIILDPYTEGSSFKKEYVDTEKNTLKQIIESKINDKEQYSFDKCIEAMYKDNPYSMYKYGYVEDIDKITNEKLYEAYKQMLKIAKIDIYVSGSFDTANVEAIFKNNQKLNELISYNQAEDKIAIEPNYNQGNDVQKVEEKLNVSQGKLVIGLDINSDKPANEIKYMAGIYNVILGGSANSKLFQNVREKASLAYSARSVYVRQKNNIFIRCGIEISDYEKALDIIKQQIEDMRLGNFTEEDIDSAKKTTVAQIKNIQDEQDAGLVYFIAQELSGEEPDFDEYIKKVNLVTREQVLEIAGKVKLNTIYFLKN